MSLYLITDAFRKLGLPDIKNDDFYDRLSRRYSLIFLGVSFLIVASSQFIGSPINCYTQNVVGSHVNYVNWVCWISSSYYIPFDKPLPSRYEQTPEKMFVGFLFSFKFEEKNQRSFLFLVHITNGFHSFYSA